MNYKKNFKTKILRTALTVFMILVFLMTDSSAEDSARVDKSAEKTHDKSEFTPGIIPFAVSIFPGIIVHGAGHYAAGDRDTALDLLIAEAAGIGLFIGGITALALTGAGEKSSAPSIVSSVTGAGLFMTSWASDVYGSAGGLNGGAKPLPRFLLSAGYANINDPLFLYENMVSLSAMARYSRLRIEASHIRAADDDNFFSESKMYYRLFDAYKESGTADGSFIDISAGGSYHHYGSEFFDLYTAELSVNTRYDLMRFSRTLKGSFCEASLGYALGIYDYDVPGYKFGEDTNDILLMRFAYGIYTGSGDGEVSVYYDHRRDRYVGGLQGGFMGYTGIRAEYFPFAGAGLSGEIQYGSALMMSLALKCRM